MIVGRSQCATLLALSTKFSTPCIHFRICASCFFSSVRSSCDTNGSRIHESKNCRGLRLNETVEGKLEKWRVDCWISSRLSGISRARVQSSIKSGLATINGKVMDKVSHTVRDGDVVSCIIPELQPLRAEPEDIHLDVVYEDEHLLVVNKPAHMVVHPASGNPTGTLINGVLHHCNSASSLLSSGVSSCRELVSDGSGFAAASPRPGVVHRLDRGTSGLLVIAKDEHSHAHLSEQFKLRSVDRVYASLTSGVPTPLCGRVDVPIGRDVNNRVRMAAVPGPILPGRARRAVSRFNVVEILAGGASAFVEWKLETGRTHQIRAHAKYSGVPLLGDELYGGTKSMAMSLLQPRTPPSRHNRLSPLVSQLDRPCLHGLALGFIHPYRLDKMDFACPPPPDFAHVLNLLRELGSDEV